MKFLQVLCDNEKIQGLDIPLREIWVQDSPYGWVKYHVATLSSVAPAKHLALSKAVFLVLTFQKHLQFSSRLSSSHCKKLGSGFFKKKLLD
jgi:hypothetical protein